MNVMRERRLRGAIPTQREVAKILGVRESAVSKWERGIARPRAEKLPILAKLYGCTIEELLADAGDAPAGGMNAASAVLFAVATELANQAKDSLPELREGEKVQREWFEDGIYKRLTTFEGRTFLSQFDFRQKKSRRVAVGGE